MRTVKEILEEQDMDGYCEGPETGDFYYEKDSILSAMKVYGEELATAFADWINEQGEEADIVDRWLNHKEETNKLFKEFIKTFKH